MPVYRHTRREMIVLKCNIYMMMWALCSMIYFMFFDSRRVFATHRYIIHQSERFRDQWVHEGWGVVLGNDVLWLYIRAGASGEVFS